MNKISELRYPPGELEPPLPLAERMLMNVTSPSGRHSLSVPSHARVADLMPAIVKACEGRADFEGWRLKAQGAGILGEEQSLAAAGLFSGAILELIEPQRAAVMDKSRIPIGARWREMLRRPEREPRIKSMGEAEYMRFLDQAIAGREISSSIVVAVMSAHPGAGNTTIAALLATMLGRSRSDAVALADANPESGALSHWLAPDAPRPDLGGEPAPEQVRAALVDTGDRASVLPAPTGAVDWERLIEHLRHLHKIVVLDCPSGFRKPASRGALAAADLVVMVTRPAHRVPQVPARTIVVVENQSPRRSRASHTPAGAQLIKVVDEPAAAGRLKTRGFLWSQAPASWQESIRELAAVLVGSAS
jgi:Mrp family chromosome partitioning ATPase